MQYSVVVLGATGNVGGRIVQLPIRNPLCKKLVVITHRKADVFAAPKGLQRGLSTWTNRRGGRALRPGSSRRPRCVRRWQGSAKMPAVATHEMISAEEVFRGIVYLADVAGAGATSL
jgi:hypothetical protein